MATVTIHIDDQPLEVDANSTIIEAAAQYGIEIPHFCWHPKLSVAGNCRMCLVEVEKMPKLVIACATKVADGMVVRTKSPRAVKARNAVMEFILINHPLDCPICDEAGECKLQDYAYKFSVGVSRFEEDKVHKPKRVELGPRIILDVERCIMCSRCIRFSEEIAGQKALTFTERGTHVVLTTFPGVQLDNPYSMNVVDICPVGALTSQEFRFRARVWEMAATESICVGCARGCNTHIWTRNNEILRLTPRQNESVNSYWMCDEGRLNSFKHVGSNDRINGCRVRRDGSLVEVGWDEAYAQVISELRSYKKHEIAGIASPYATNEDNFVFYQLLHDIVGTKHLYYLPHRIEGSEDALLIRADKTPNTTGVEKLGFTSLNNSTAATELLERINDKSIKLLYVLEDDIAVLPMFEKILNNVQVLIVHSSLYNATTARADVVIAASTFAEKHGTMTNFEGIVQRIRPAVTTTETDRALDGFEMSRWDKFAAPNDRWGKGRRIDARPSWKSLTLVAHGWGGKLKYTDAESVFRSLAATNPAFKGLTYAKIGSSGAKLAI